MTTTWAVVAIVGAATIAIRAVGPVAHGGRTLPPRVLALVELLAPTLLGALIAVNVFAGERRLVLDARAVGLAAAALALTLRAPILVAVILAAATTAVVRAV